MKRQTIKFLIVGILNTVVGYAVYFISLQFLGIAYIWSLLISHIIGIIHSYVWNYNWTFKSKSGNNINSLVKFCSVYVLTFLLNLVILTLLVRNIGLNALLGQAVALLATTVLSFFGHKYWSFKN